jgi:hypothetical protein
MFCSNSPLHVLDDPSALGIRLQAADVQEDGIRRVFRNLARIRQQWVLQRATWRRINDGRMIGGLGREVTNMIIVFFQATILSS